MMKRLRKLFHALVVLAGFAAFTVLGSDSNKPNPPAAVPTVSWDRTFLTPSFFGYNEADDNRLSITWAYTKEAASSTLHIQVRPKDDSEPWITLFVGPIYGFGSPGAADMGEWFGSVGVDEKVYIWVEYVAPPVVHTNGVYHLSGVYHAMDTAEPKYVAPTIDVKFVGDDDGQSLRNWKAYEKEGEVNHE